MKILLVTGKSAEDKVRSIASKFGCEVLAVPVGAASFLTPQLILKSFKKLREKKFDLIIVPEVMGGSLKIIQNGTGITTLRSSKDIGSLEQMLESMEPSGKWYKSPADAMAQMSLDELTKSGSKNYVKAMLKKPGNMLIGKLPIGRDFPIRVLAEIVDVGNLSKEEILEKARHFKASGADILDLGFNEKAPEKLEKAVNLLKDLNIPLSVDTMEKENIERAVELEIDLILSFDRELLKEFHDIEVPSVIIPGRADVPAKPEDRVKALERNVKLAEKKGFENIIADPILQPVNFGFVDSVIAYKKFGRAHSYPILMGVGNVTELFDADSTGMNALLAAIASECEASIVFTVEASSKTRGSVAELVTAARMMQLSRLRGSPPKDLGIDLLFLKEKKKYLNTLS